MDFEKRTKALKVLKYLSLVQLFLVTFVLITGGVASQEHGQSAPGVPPYYLGVFIVGPMALLNVVLGFAICLKGRDCLTKAMAAQKTGCLLQTYCISLPFIWLGCFITLMITAFTGICTNTECSYLEHPDTNRRIAITIVTAVVMVFISSVFNLVLICMYAQHFGVRLLSRGQYRISNVLPETTQQDPIYVTHENTISNFQVQEQCQPQEVELDTVQSLRDQYLQQSSRLNHEQVRQHRQTLDIWLPTMGPSGDSDNERSRPYAIDSPPTTVITNQNDLDDGRHVEGVQRQSQSENGHQHKTSHRKKRRRRKVRPKNSKHNGHGAGYILPPLVNFGLPPPPPSPPPPPNTPPPPLSPSDEFLSASPPLYFVNEYVNEYVNEVVDLTDLPPPYTP